MQALFCVIQSGILNKVPAEFPVEDIIRALIKVLSVHLFSQDWVVAYVIFNPHALAQLDDCGDDNGPISYYNYDQLCEEDKVNADKLLKMTDYWTIMDLFYINWECMNICKNISGYSENDSAYKFGNYSKSTLEIAVMTAMTVTVEELQRCVCNQCIS